MKISKAIPDAMIKSVIDSLVATTFESIMVTEPSSDQAHAPIVFVNEAFTKLTGYSPEEVLGKSPALLQGDETEQAVLDRLRDDLGAGQMFEGATANYRKDGSKFTMHWRVATVTGEDHQPLYFVAVQREQGA